MTETCVPMLTRCPGAKAEVEGAGAVRCACSKTPTVLWAQRTSCVYLTFEVVGCVEPDIHIEPSGTHVCVGLTAAQRAPADTADRFRVELDLWGAVVPEVRIASLQAGPLSGCGLRAGLRAEAARAAAGRVQRSKHNAGVRSLVLVLEKVRLRVHTRRGRADPNPAQLAPKSESFDWSLVLTAAQAEPGFWPRLLQPKGPSPRYLKVDWNLWVDQDEEEEKPQCAAHVLSDRRCSP